MQAASVIRILSEHRLVISLPANMIVGIGDEVSVLGKTDDILDPATGKSLGAIDSVKARLSVSDVYENFAVCETEYISPAGMKSLFGQSPNALFRQDRINVNEKDINPLKDDKSPVEVGDRVKIVHKDK